MSVVSVRARSFILALFIRDDDERFLLGDNGYDFKDNQLHFSANAIENDEVVMQGADGVMLAGQVRRSSVQSFDGFVGDATMAKDTIEQMRRDFFAFFVKGHHFRVVYVDCNRNAWQRKGGYLVDAPEVKELWQIHPEYHVGLNFEDVNYYSYNENSDGEEILANLVDVPVSAAASGGLVWDDIGAVSEDAVINTEGETATSSKGNPITITNAVDAPLADYEIYGNATQDGTPTPSAPVAVQTVTGEQTINICGKNLLDIENNLKASDSGLDFSYSNDKLVVSGTPTRSYANVTNEINTFLAAGQYTLSLSEAVSHRVYIWVRYTDGVAASLGIINAGSTSVTTTFAKDVAQIRLDFSGMTTGVALNESFGVQLEARSSASSYEPYQGQSYEVNLGKNLFDGANANAKTGYILNDSGTEVSDNAGGYTRNYSAVKPNTTYTLSGMANAGTRRIYFYDGSKTFLSRSSGYTASSITFTTPANCYFVNVQIYTNTDTSSAIASWQIELGSQATSYAAYFTPIELCKIGDYQDYIYKSGGKWYVHKAVGKYQLDGTINWYVNGTNNYQCTRSGDNKLYLAASATGLSNYFNVSNSSTGINMYPITQTGTDYIRITNAASEWASADLFKTFLTNNAVYLYYPLAESAQADTEITNQALITQLEAILSARTKVGTTTITLTPNGGATGELQVEYYTSYSQIVVEGGYVWEEGSAGGITTIVNNSIDNVSPIWTVYGPTTNPQLENSTTGETIEYVGTIAEGQTLTVDMGEQTASLDGLNVISNLVGDFISLAPGANKLIYSVSGDAGASEIGWSEIVG